MPVLSVTLHAFTKHETWCLHGCNLWIWKVEDLEAGLRLACVSWNGLKDIGDRSRITKKWYCVFFVKSIMVYHDDLVLTSIMSWMMRGCLRWWTYFSPTAQAWLRSFHFYEPAGFFRSDRFQRGQSCEWLAARITDPAACELWVRCPWRSLASNLWLRSIQLLPLTQDLPFATKIDTDQGVNLKLKLCSSEVLGFHG